MVTGTKTVFIVLKSVLLSIFIWIFCISSSIVVTEAIKEDIGRRKLATKDSPGFISIDCGVEEDYLDDELGIFYKSDKDFINTGENHDVLPKYAGKDRKVYDNLRSFPEGKRNCYTLKPEQGKNNYYIMRAYFLYGNYDGNGTDQVPEFDLYIGVYYWKTVKLTSESALVYYEIVYFFSADTDYLCLVNTGSGIPFISGLEMRLLDNFPFNTTGHGALNYWAMDLGIQSNFLVTFPNNLTYRYKDDGCDRMWQLFPYQNQILGCVAITTSLKIDKGNNGLPVEVLRTAIKPRNGSNSMTFSFKSTSPTDQHFLLFHFAEIEGVAQNLLREFTISLNGVKSQPIKLEYLKPLSLSSNWTSLADDVNVTLDATTDSDLPPILNAIEMYKVLPFSLSPTDQADVDAIMAIKHTYNINKDDWQGDPCLPKEYTWSGISCRFNSTPRIISLNLSASELTGKISFSFSDLQAIESLDLSNNELSGQVPEALAQLPNLKILNLSGNKFKGSIPQSLKDKSDNGSLALSLAGNPDLCLMGPCSNEEKKFGVPVVASIVASVLVLIFLSILLVFYMIRRRRKPVLKGRIIGSNHMEGQELQSPALPLIHVAERLKSKILSSKNRPFTYSEILHITNNLHDMIGEGGFGKVYLGTLDDGHGTKVAVKLLSSTSKQGHKEFETEAQLLMIVHHKMLVSLIGYCEDEGHLALVYEYVVNGNLWKHLSGANPKVLSWEERLQIAVDTAQGIEYLHEGCKLTIIHRDLKTTNILLTEDMRAKIADFGLSRVFATEFDTHVSTLILAGTPGYLDPELHECREPNKKNDVYSFGIILFELITGKPAVIKTTDGRSFNIRKWLSPTVEKGDIGSIVDPRLLGEFDVNAARKMVKIAMSCTHRTSDQRPDMSFVLKELKECLCMSMPVEKALGSTQRMQNDITTSDNSVEMSGWSTRAVCQSEIVPEVIRMKLQTV